MNDIPTDNFTFILQHREKNGNYSIVGLAENAISADMVQSIFSHLESLTFQGGVTSFGEIPREQLWINSCGEDFGVRAGWKDVDNPRWKAHPFDGYLRGICALVQLKFASYGLHMIDGVCDAKYDSLLGNKYRGLGDSIKPHRDSEEVFGNNPSVMIVSVGYPREMIFRRIIYNKEKLKSIKIDKTFDGVREFSVTLPSGSILFMGGEVQKYYSHEIRKVRTESDRADSSPDVNLVRYSLTFRQYSR